MFLVGFKFPDDALLWLNALSSGCLIFSWHILSYQSVCVSSLMVFVTCPNAQKDEFKIIRRIILDGQKCARKAKDIPKQIFSCNDLNVS